MLFSYRSYNEQQQEILSGFNTDEITEFQEAIVKTPGGNQRILVVLLRNKRPAPTVKDKYGMVAAMHEIFHEEDIKRFYSLEIHSVPQRETWFFNPNSDKEDTGELDEDETPANVRKMNAND